jgi:uncharacterized protein
VNDDHELPAGDFSSWLHEVQGAIRGDNDARVPCDGCTACCTASQFVHIGPEETDTLAHIPAELLFPAPRLPPGHVLLGHDEHGHCPMLVDGACSIYEHRPRTCRSYDCRVFAAAGIEPTDADKVLIADRVRRWRFRYPTAADRARHDAVRAAAKFVRDRSEALPPERRPTNESQLAVLAVEQHEEILAGDVPDRPME